MEIADKINKGFLDPKHCVEYNQHLHQTDLLDADVHAAFRDRVEEEKAKSFAGSEHDALCTTPSYLAEDALGARKHLTLVDVLEGRATIQDLEGDAAAYRKQYLQDAQYVFSRVQHHVHNKHKDGSYTPLHNCAKKTKKKGKCTVCKHDFPMTKLCVTGPVVVCRGMAKKLALRVAGRRNATGKIIGKRRCEWQSGTTPALAVLFRSNSHTAPNYRLPLMAATHDKSCPSKACAEWIQSPNALKTISKLAQRAQREATGYYCGYTFKRQPIGTKFLKSVGDTMNYLTTGMQDKTTGQKWHRITHRLLTDFQHRMMTRTAPEETNLAAYWHDHDPTTAEFNRTYRSEDFHGGQLVQRLEQEEKHAAQHEWQKVVPKAHGRGSGQEDLVRHSVDFYGFRGTHPAVYYLSPWEFVKLWEVVPLPRPKVASEKEPVAVSRWRTKTTASDEPDEYEPNPEAAPAQQDACLLYTSPSPRDS